MLKRVYEFLKQSGVFFVATEADDEPKVRPFGFVMVYQNKLYFCTNNQKKVYMQMKENPNVEICACMGAKWLRVSGKAVFSKDMDAKRQVFIEDESMSQLYKPEDEIFEIFYLDQGKACFCDMAGNCEESEL